MPALYTNIGPWTLPTFTLVVAIALAAGAGLALRRVDRIDRAADALLGALIGGVILARLFHVILHWDYFSTAFPEAFDLAAGGLDWHGAILGGLLGLALVASWRHISFARLLDRLTPALPLIGLASWYGCLAAGCGYGLEVDTLARYPAFAASETVDVYGIVAPRFNTWLFGLLLCAAGLGLAGILSWRGWLPQRRFWVILTLLATGMFGIGFLRADPMPIISGLRADQWLDALTAAWALALSVRRLPFEEPVI